MKNLAVLIIAFALLQSCYHMPVRGSGNVKTITKYYKGYTGVKLEGKGIVRIKQSPNFRFSATADDNILEITDVTINDDVLEISYIRDFNSTKIPEFVIEAPQITTIEAEGRARIISDNVMSVPNMEVELDGAAKCNLNVATRDFEIKTRGISEVVVEGTAERFEVKSQGSSRVSALELSAETVELELAGTGKIEVYAAEKLDVQLRGTTDVYYAGNPNIESRVYGTGRITPIDYSPEQKTESASAETTKPAEQPEVKQEEPEESTTASADKIE
jgi:hypothetical protein